MRMIAGQWRGRPLVAPAGLATRPTSARAREALFSMLQSRLGSFEGLNVADFFAGTGALGLEALSRGAAKCTFIENSPDAVAALQANVNRLGAAERSLVLRRSIDHAPPPSQPFDLVLMDPPYGEGLAERALARISEPLWLAAGALVCIEHGGDLEPPAQSFAVEAERRFGKARVALLRWAG